MGYPYVIFLSISLMHWGRISYSTGKLLFWLVWQPGSSQDLLVSIPNAGIIEKGSHIHVCIWVLRDSINSLSLGFAKNHITSQSQSQARYITLPVNSQINAFVTFIYPELLDSLQYEP